ncbi:histidine kinase [Salegentibacter sp. LM13S]|uniref:sensor histidine kinase n=1 Tax=Salegentibacter lacus TaxID=2873599 RepID=UPI001CCDEFAB|nr:histidine kinase [Salegentibacter lacus]MBZ9630528.1 histidine kinase [Salegentibacter lacus]
MLSKEELLLIIYFVVVILLLTAFVIVFFIVYQRRKNKMLLEQFEAEKRFEREISQSRLEMQEQTLKNVGWELHDNIGQLLSVANMQLNIFSKNLPEAEKTSVLEIKETVASSLQEVRSLSKSLNNQVIGYAGLVVSVENELARFQRMGVIEAQLEITGEKQEIPQQHSIILFRILQEFFSNVIKHAKASALIVRIEFTSEEIIITAKDNGQGFDLEEVQKNSGLFNMESRAALIQTKFKLESAMGKGTFLSLRYSLMGQQDE